MRCSQWPAEISRCLGDVVWSVAGAVPRLCSTSGHHNTIFMIRRIESIYACTIYLHMYKNTQLRQSMDFVSVSTVLPNMQLTASSRGDNGTKSISRLEYGIDACIDGVSSYCLVGWRGYGLFLASPRHVQPHLHPFSVPQIGIAPGSLEQSSFSGEQSGLELITYIHPSPST